jgi:hypothetical protein
MRRGRGTSRAVEVDLMEVHCCVCASNSAEAGPLRACHLHWRKSSRLEPLLSNRTCRHDHYFVVSRDGMASGTVYPLVSSADAPARAIEA